MDHPDTTAAEFEMLTRFLDFYRAVIERKAAGVDAEGLRARLVPSEGTTIGGIVKHLVRVEWWWFTAVFAGDRTDMPTPEERALEFIPGPSDSAESLVAAYRAACDESRRVVAERPDLDATVSAGRRGAVSLRWILVHMIEETARHAGHLDLLREAWDGSTGD